LGSKPWRKSARKLEVSSKARDRSLDDNAFGFQQRTANDVRKPKEAAMIVGILKEIKAEENRVCMTPAGAEIVNTPQWIFERADMVMPVKEPLPAE
jgi:hypothetical protein